MKGMQETKLLGHVHAVHKVLSNRSTHQTIQAALERFFMDNLDPLPGEPDPVQNRMQKQLLSFTLLRACDQTAGSIMPGDTASESNLRRSVAEFAFWNLGMLVVKGFCGEAAGLIEKLVMYANSCFSEARQAYS